WKHVTSPNPGGSEGDQVGTGQPVLVLEAMKMQHMVAAPHAGTIADLPVRTGQQVEAGAVLAVVAEHVDAEQAAERGENDD
ncbi:MAG: acetyl-CoA carboxylase biotin carboxyl carrier protein subunit, partial [Nocardioidaceae bacterium]